MTAAPAYPARRLARLFRSEDGGALVEFGLLLPTFLLFFAVALEGARTFWSYQATISGVRDAARYVGRATPSNICTTGGSLSGMTGTVTAIVQQTSSGNAIFPSSITVNSVTPTLTCIAGSYRLTQTPIANVTAVLQISYPFQSMFAFMGATLPPVTTSVTDSSRIFGA
ncbi:MAG: TadE/TadG family type IV pilus assembly protein [Rhodobacter sp.]|nr:TadE/TadG family type IV pilus assembly protein [Rhodobacter sp.]